MSFVNLKSVLKNTTNNNYCIGAFNFNSFEDAQGIINAATKFILQ